MSDGRRAGVRRKLGRSGSGRYQVFSLDPTGNWTDYVQKNSGSTVLDQQRDHNMVNEIDTDEIHGDADNPITETTGTAWVDPVYDAAGNMTTIPKPADLTVGFTLAYDAWNRMVEVQMGALTRRCEYDGLNRKTLMSHALFPISWAGTHFFYNASWQVLETRDSTTDGAEPEGLSVTRHYVWSARYIDAPVLRDRSGVRLYYVGDANFNVTALVGTSGIAVERYLYAPYGTVTVYDGSWSSTRVSTYHSNVYLYTGREHDPLTGLYHYNNRFYHAELGRFLSQDPIVYRGGDVNLYRHGSNNPANLLDPSGCTSAPNENVIGLELLGLWAARAMIWDATVRDNCQYSAEGHV